MTEIIVLGIVAVLVYRRQQRLRGWNGEDWRLLARRCVGRASDWLAGTARATPGAVTQCRADVLSLWRDVSPRLPAGADARIESMARRFAGAAPEAVPTAEPGAVQETEPSAARRRLATPAPAGPPSPQPETSAAPPSHGRAWQELQRRYLDGRITLDEYVREARRLRAPAPSTVASRPR